MFYMSGNASSHSEKCVDGPTLLSMDVHLFGKHYISTNIKRYVHITVHLLAELGIDSAEIRELFLSKIYELSNPSGSVAGMQDDFHCKQAFCKELLEICLYMYFLHHCSLYSVGGFIHRTGLEEASGSSGCSEEPCTPR